MTEREICECNTTWILDIPTLTWKQHIIEEDCQRTGHTSTEGISGSVVITGGLPSPKWVTVQRQYQNRTIYVKQDPKSLQHLAIKIIYAHKDTLAWRVLPKKLITAIMFPGML